MKTNRIITLAMIGAAMAASAVPARRGFRNVTQPDGTTVAIGVVGDEFSHYLITTDSLPLLRDSRGRICYATFSDTDGTVVSTGILAHDPAQRGDSEVQLVSTVDRRATTRAMTSAPQTQARTDVRRDAQTQAIAQTGMGRYHEDFPVTGDVRTIVFLVEYQDVRFKTPDAAEYYKEFFNSDAFTGNGATGSARQYFLDSSCGQFRPEFDVYGPVTLPYNRAYYGSSYNEFGMYVGQEPAHLMLRDAAELLDDTTDFSLYDLDGDGEVENVVIMYAGEGENSAQEIEECVWPHQWRFTYSGLTAPVHDGVTIDHYACFNEWVDDHTAGIGTFIHEFSHVMGLPDLYSTRNTSLPTTPGRWSVMDRGCYLNDSRTPCAYSAYERLALGWMEPELLTADNAIYTLENLAASNKAYIIESDDPDDFFLVENRQNVGWDSVLLGHGMLVWHVHNDDYAFRGNNVNSDPEHPYVDLIEANNQANLKDDEVMAGYAFPGPAATTMLGFNTTPAMKPWTGNDTGIVLCDIAETADGLLTFEVNGEGAGIGAVTDAGSAALRVDGRRVTASGRITVYDITGRRVACGEGVADIAAPGLYVVEAAGTNAKIVIR